MDSKSAGFVRDRSSRRAREGENDSASNIDAMSVGSRRQMDEYNISPLKMHRGGPGSQGDD